MTASKTPNQIVAYNLRRARDLRGWTQQQTVEKLAPFLGSEISRSNLSLMEGSYDRDTRIRNFTADDLVAFSAAFELPVLWFLLPAVEKPEDADAITAAVAVGEDIEMRDYLDRVWPLLDLAGTTHPDPAVGALEKRLMALSPLLGFDVAERVRAAVAPQAAKAVLAAMPTVLEFIRVLDEGAGALQAWVGTLRGYLGGSVVDPAWEKALEVALTERGEEE